MKNAPALASTRFLSRLDTVVTACVALTVALRPFSPGQPADEAETALLCALIWFAACVWLLRKLAAAEVSLPATCTWPALGAFAICIALAVQRAWSVPYAGDLTPLGVLPFSDGNGRLAFDAGYIVFTHIALAIVIADHFRDPQRFRMLVACLCGGLCMILAYSLYQRGYGMAYLRQTIDTESVVRLAGTDEVHQQLFANRLASNRIFGAFAYPNALASFFVLLTPLAAGLFANRRDTGQTSPGDAHISPIQGLLLFGAALAMILSGSKAGFLAAKAAEWLSLTLIVPGVSSLTILGGLALTTLAQCLAGACVFTVAQLLGAPVDTAILTAQITLAAAWWAEAALLLRLSAASASRASWIRKGGMAVLLCGLVSGIWFIQKDSARDLPAFASMPHAIAVETVRVRANYWAAAMDMTGDHPLRGVGLDNFGSRYPQYKRPTGWAVKRAHNHYLQLAADGGLPLLASFLILIGLLARTMHRTRNGNRPEETLSAQITAETSNTDTIAPQTRAMIKNGFILCAAVFVLTYGGFLVNLTGGLSFEFFYRELQASPGLWSVRGTTGSTLPLLVHGGTHLLLLPAAWLGGYLAAERLTRRIRTRRMAPWIGVGLAGILLHAVADFHLSTASIGLLFWTMTGLALAAGISATCTWTPGRRTALLLLLAAGVASALVMEGVAIPQLQGVLEKRIAAAYAEETLAKSRKGPAQTDQALTHIAAALAERPRDKDLHRLRAMLLVLEAARTGGMHKERTLAPSPAATLAATEALNAWRGVIACNPYDPAGFAALARHAILFQRLVPEAASLAGQAWARAIALHPYKPEYRLELARLRIAEGKPDDARALLEKALDIQNTITDERAQLTAEQQAEVKRLLRRIAPGSHRRLPPPETQSEKHAQESAGGLAE